MNFDELVEKLNALKIIQTSSDWFEDIPDEFEKEFEGSETLEYELNVDKRRGHELSTQVIKIKDRYLGVESITNLYSEQSRCEDIYHRLKFFEMVSVETITYVKKQQG